MTSALTATALKATVLSVPGGGEARSRHGRPSAPNLQRRTARDARGCPSEVAPAVVDAAAAW
ncbi:MAG: hypothetical protein VB093_17170 [Propionicimonas sp.]|nr:hypothetical protein [Propionicimonas sp.]